MVLATVDGARLVHETWSAAGRTLRSVTLDGRRSTEVGAIPDDLRLRPSPVQTADGAPMPSGWVLLTPDGRLPGDGVSGGQLLRHIPDGATVPLDEATR